MGEACLEDDAILFWRVDRLSRNIVKSLSWMEDLDNRGVTLYSHNENITYKSNKLEFLQCVLDAQKEAKILGERVKLAYKRKRDRGDERVGSIPYGKKYKRVYDDDGNIIKNIVVDHPEESSIIWRICRSNKKASEIANNLNNEGIYKRNKQWNRMMVMRIKREHKKK